MEVFRQSHINVNNGYQPGPEAQPNLAALLGIEASYLRESDCAILFDSRTSLADKESAFKRLQEWVPNDVQSKFHLETIVENNRTYTQFLIAGKEVQKVIAVQNIHDKLLNPNNCFHGIFCEISKIRSICDHGILSTNEANRRTLSISCNFGSIAKDGTTEPGYNGRNHISLARSPMNEAHKGQGNGAFKSYIENYISFIILDPLTTPCLTSGITGEVLAGSEIAPSKLGGIMLSDELANKSISDINFMAGGACGVFHIRCQAMYQFISQEYGVEDAELLQQFQTQITANDGLDQMEKLRNDYEKKINQFVVLGMVKKFNRPADQIKLIDVLHSLVPQDFPISSSTGVFPKESIPNLNLDSSFGSSAYAKPMLYEPFGSELSFNRMGGLDFSQRIYGDRISSLRETQARPNLTSRAFDNLGRIDKLPNLDGLNLVTLIDKLPSLDKSNLVTLKDAQDKLMGKIPGLVQIKSSSSFDFLYFEFSDEQSKEKQGKLWAHLPNIGNSAFEKNCLRLLATVCPKTILDNMLLASQ